MSRYRFRMPFHIIVKYYLISGLLSVTTLSGQVSAEVVTSKEEPTGLSRWEWRHEGISLQLIQRSPDQTRAFFQARGFSSTDADVIGRACVFQTIFRNAGKVSLAYDLSEWKITSQEKELGLQTRERWEERWLKSGVNQAPRIAMNWSLLPTQQKFEPGDYNWGMTSFGLPPGTSFDLALKLNIQNQSVNADIPSIICADE